jgi:hypothetical protein
MPDPVAWKVIEHGWQVVDSAGADVGTVAEVVGDLDADIFSGLEISTGLLAGKTSVSSDKVGEIVEGRVQLLLTKAELDALGDAR